MNNIIMSTVGTNRVNRIRGIALGASAMAAGLLLKLFIDTDDILDLGLISLIRVIIVVLLAAGIICIMRSVMLCGSYLVIYDEYIEGRGMTRPWRMESFHMESDLINNVTVSSYSIYVNAEDITYRICTTKGGATNVLRYFKTNQRIEVK